MSIGETYSNRARQAQETFVGASQARLRGAKAALKLVPTPGNGLMSPARLCSKTAASASASST